MKGCITLFLVAGAYVLGIVTETALLHPGPHPDTIAFIVALVMVIPAIVAYITHSRSRQLRERYARYVVVKDARRPDE